MSFGHYNTSEMHCANMMGIKLKTTSVGALLFVSNWCVQISARQTWPTAISLQTPIYSKKSSIYVGEVYDTTNHCYGQACRAYQLHTLLLSVAATLPTGPKAAAASMHHAEKDMSSTELCTYDTSMVHSMCTAIKAPLLPLVQLTTVHLGSVCKHFSKHWPAT